MKNKKKLLFAFSLILLLGSVKAAQISTNEGGANGQGKQEMIQKVLDANPHATSVVINDIKYYSNGLKVDESVRVDRPDISKRVMKNLQPIFDHDSVFTEEGVFSNDTECVDKKNKVKVYNQCSRIQILKSGRTCFRFFAVNFQYFDPAEITFQFLMYDEQRNKVVDYISEPGEVSIPAKSKDKKCYKLLFWIHREVVSKVKSAEVSVIK